MSNPLFLNQITDAQLDAVRATGDPLFFRGTPGVGKSSRPRDYVKSRKLGLVVDAAPTLDSPDIAGLLMPSKSEGAARYIKPSWLARIEKQIAAGFTEGIYLVEEIMSGNQDVQKAYRPLMSEREVNEWVLPDGWVIWFTGNRSTDKSGASKSMYHWANACATIDVVPHVQSWEQWALDNDIHPMYIAFAINVVEEVFGDTPPKDPNIPQCTPRSLVRAAKYHTQFAGGPDGMRLPTDPVTMAFVSGYIGSASVALTTYLNTYEHLPTIQEILEDVHGAKLPPEDMLSAHHVVAQMCVGMAEPDTLDTLFTYCTRLRKEFQTSVARQMVHKFRGKAMNAPSISKFLVENATLVSDSMNVNI